MKHAGSPEHPRGDEGYWRLRRTAAHAAFRASRDLLLDYRDDYDAAYARFHWPRPRCFNWALEWFDVMAEGNHAPALIMLDGHGRSTTIDFAQLAATSNAVAGWLAVLGIRRGDRVLIALDQRPELWETILACMKLGAVVIPAYTSLTAAEAADRVSRADVRHVVCESRLTHLFGRAGPVQTRITVGPASPGWHDYREGPRFESPYSPVVPTLADEIAFCYFTSGTTAAPKLVAHTHASYPVGHLSGMYWSGLRPGDRHLNVSAPGWAKHAWSSLFVPWNAEAAIVALPARPIEGSELPGLLARHEVTTFCAPPSTWRSMLPALDSARPVLREALSAGGPLDRPVSEAVQRAWGVQVRDGYGQTETTGLIGTTPGMPTPAGWLGKPLPGYQIWLRDQQTGAPAARGEICVALGPAPVGVMRGYLTRGDGDGTGEPGGACYATGDMGEQDAEGWIRVEGRSDDIFKSFGHRISPSELETVLRSHPAVADAAVVPRFHPVGGAVAHAVVELLDPDAGDPHLEAELLAHVDARVAPELRVHSLSITRLLPRTASGKVRRNAINVICPPGQPNNVRN